MMKHSKESLLDLIRTYHQLFEEAVPGLVPQLHEVVPGQPLDKQQALERAHTLMSAARNLAEVNDLDSAHSYYYMGRDIAKAHDIAVDEFPKKPS